MTARLALAVGIVAALAVVLGAGLQEWRYAR